ncbi:MAG: TonB-dependent receptor [Bryobacteraceae bacterium]|nr:TonB-dependent receptor [Bryobacteraceae bacterium]
MTTKQVTPIKSKLLFGVLLPALLFATSASAQTASAAPADSEATIELNPFRVSTKGDAGYFSKNTLMGTRSTERIVNIPQSISVINSEFLRDLNLDNGIDSFKYGVSGINKREATSNDTFIRGFRVGGNAFLRNGVRSRGSYNTPQYDVDRIEVVKGPAALLYGLDSGSGGLVNYITGTASKQAESYIKGTVSSFNLYRGEAATAGPLLGGDMHYRVTVAATNADSRRRFDFFKDAFFSLAGDYRLSETAEVSYYYNYYYLNQVISKESVDSLGKLMNLPRDFSPGEKWADAPRWTQNFYIAYTNAVTPTFKTRFFVNGSEQNFHFLNIINARVPDALGNMNRTFQDRSGKERVISMQVDALKTFDTGQVSHKFTFGGAAKLQRLNTRFDNLVLAPINVFNPVYGTPIPQFVRGVVQPGGSTASTIQRAYDGSIFAQEQASMFHDKLMIVGGLGWTGVNSWTFNSFTKATTATQIDGGIVHRYGAVYKPAPWASVYVSQTESISFFNQVFVGGPRTGEILDPSITKNKEFGLKAETSDGFLFGSVVLFDMDRTNVTLNYIQANGQPGVGQEGRETNKGWEADIGLGFKNPAGPLQLILTYYDGDSRNIAGAVPNGVSNKMWSFFATQKVTTGPLNGLKFGAGLYYKDDFAMANATGQTVAFVSPGFTTSTAFANYTRGKLDFSVNCDNITDKKYIDGGDGAGVLDISLGRTFRFTVGYRF